MKATIDSINATSNSQFIANVSVKDDKGTLLLSRSIGFNLVQSDPASAISYIKKVISDSAKQYLAEQASVAVPEIQKIIGQEFDI